VDTYNMCIWSSTTRTRDSTPIKHREPFIPFKPIPALHYSKTIRDFCAGPEIRVSNLALAHLPLYLRSGSSHQLQHQTMGIRPGHRQLPQPYYNKCGCQTLSRYSNCRRPVPSWDFDILIVPEAVVIVL